MRLEPLGNTAAGRPATFRRGAGTRRGGLDRRQEQLLAAVVEGFVASSTPVASRALTGQTGERLSAATIRSALATLERAGCLYRPHPSAGRVPTDAGYRYYVDRLLESGRSSGDGRELAARVRRSSPGAAVRALAREFECFVVGVSSAASATGDEVWLSGAGYLLRAAEFGDPARAARLLELVDRPAMLRTVLRGLLGRDRGPQIRIGREHDIDALAACTSVAFALSDRTPATLVALVGPTRLDYRSLIPRVAGLLDRIER